MTRSRVLTGRHFMSGDHACAEGALAAGCDFFAGYPITPSTEIAERLAERLPEVGGVFIQMEDELASMAAVIGAAWGGATAMTATSGPGFTLMMENVGLAVMTETPCVVVDVMRGSPSTGLPTLAGQGDVMQARWGSHGDYEVVAYCPASAQEAFDLTAEAFNTANRYRIPVFVLTDEVVGHMTEPVVIPPENAIERVAVLRPGAAGAGRAAAEGDPLLPFHPGEDLVPPMPRAGDGHRIHVTGLTHDERGYPAMSPAVHDRLVRRLCDKVRRHAAALIRYEELWLDDAEVVVLAYGCTARSARQAVRAARRDGLRAGLFRPITLWPFPEERVARLGREVGALVVAELNLGQVAREVERFVKGPVARVQHAGGALLHPDAILDALREAAG